MKDLSFNYNGETLYLPTWYIFESDEKIEEAKEIVTVSMIAAESEQPSESVIDEYDADIDSWSETEEHILKELKKEGYTFEQIEEIFARYYSGQTLNAAMQSV